jgi:hypothetical protein
LGVGLGFGFFGFLVFGCWVGFWVFWVFRGLGVGLGEKTQNPTQKPNFFWVPVTDPNPDPRKKIELVAIHKLNKNRGNPFKTSYLCRQVG